MSFIQALILGIVQGLTEFLPISSSGHLKLGQYLLGMTHLEDYILFDLACHLGTLLAVVLVFWQDIKALVGTERRRLFLITLALLPLFPLVIVLKPLKEVMGAPEYLGFFFLLTAFLLFMGERRRWGDEGVQEKKRGKSHALLIGCAQALAVLPGVSRSGSTLSIARLLGWGRWDAARFSFLISIPAILGGTFLELLQLWQGKVQPGNVEGGAYFLGFLMAFASGYLALMYLLRILRSGSLIGFAWYCFLLGIFTLIITA